jgi:hypothetical protein
MFSASNMAFHLPVLPPGKPKPGGRRIPIGGALGGH